MILIDSDILIWILRDDEQYKNLFKSIVEETNGELFITPIQYMEIMTGIREKERINTELFLDSFETIVIDKKIGKLAGDYLRKFSKSHGIHSADALIAATVKIYGYKLWTNNKKHYPMIDHKTFLYS